MTAEERFELMRNDLIESHLSTVEIVDKYCECATSELRASLIVQLETLRHLYNLKGVTND